VFLTHFLSVKRTTILCKIRETEYGTF